ncbi:PilZ domain-containing protein [Spirochaetia bacterium 38H-sp]|uniref:PilZ domain-containing protein n=1 Tax=Rarispira pelagica TaxID=3141764 RepID=A0ABU9U9Q1_9SPIR
MRTEVLMGGAERRRFPRARVDVLVMYDIVDWKETELVPEAGATLHTRDISASGVGLAEGFAVDKHMFKKLINGKKKLRIALQLPGETEMLYCFARLVWGAEPVDGRIERAGFAFIDVSPVFFSRVRDFVQRWIDREGR